MKYKLRFNMIYSTVKPRYTVPRYTVNPDIPAHSLPPKYGYLQAFSVNKTPIYREPRYTGVFSFPPRSPVYRGFTVYIFPGFLTSFIGVCVAYLRWDLIVGPILWIGLIDLLFSSVGTTLLMIQTVRAAMRE